MIDNGFIFLDFIEICFVAFNFLSAPMVLDKKVYFLCLDYMFVCLTDTVNGIIPILCLHILF